MQDKPTFIFDKADARAEQPGAEAILQLKNPALETRTDEAFWAEFYTEICQGQKKRNSSARPQDGHEQSLVASSKLETADKAAKEASEI